MVTSSMGPQWGRTPPLRTARSIPNRARRAGSSSPTPPHDRHTHTYLEQREGACAQVPGGAVLRFAHKCQEGLRCALRTAGRRGCAACRAPARHENATPPPHPPLPVRAGGCGAGSEEQMVVEGNGSMADGSTPLGSPPPIPLSTSAPTAAPPPTPLSPAECKQTCDACAYGRPPPSLSRCCSKRSASLRDSSRSPREPWPKPRSHRSRHGTTGPAPVTVRKTSKTGWTPIA